MSDIITRTNHAADCGADSVMVRPPQPLTTIRAKANLAYCKWRAGAEWRGQGVGRCAARQN
jgi:hypothetical protein